MCQIRHPQPDKTTCHGIADEGNGPEKRTTTTYHIASAVLDFPVHIFRFKAFGGMSERGSSFCAH